MEIYCVKCGKKVAKAKEIDGITTWFPVCSECLYNTKGWTKEEISKLKMEVKL